MWLAPNSVGHQPVGPCLRYVAPSPAGSRASGFAVASPGTYIWNGGGCAPCTQPVTRSSSPARPPGFGVADHLTRTSRDAFTGASLPSVPIALRASLGPVTIRPAPVHSPTRSPAPTAAFVSSQPWRIAATTPATSAARARLPPQRGSERSNGDRRASDVEHCSVVSLEDHVLLPGNDVCADCGAPEPEWASTNQGTLLCIGCAGTHRSLGTHVSKVKSLKLDSWKPEEIQAFVAHGGNSEANRRLARAAQARGVSGRFLLPPPRGASRAEVDRHIAAKYRVAEYDIAVPPSGDRLHSLEDGGKSGTTCHQGLVIVEVLGATLEDDRVRNLRMLGPLFLSLAVSLSLGPLTAEPTTSKRGSGAVCWTPPERREILWDTEERWLWCSVFDGGHFGGDAQVAGHGRLDLLAVLAQQQEGGNGGRSITEVVDLYVPEEEDSDDEHSDDDNDGTDTDCSGTEVSPISHRSVRSHGSGGTPPSRRSRERPPRPLKAPSAEADSRCGFGSASTPPPSGDIKSHRRRAARVIEHDEEDDDSNPAAQGAFCGVARLKLTLIDMTGMLTTQEKRPIGALDDSGAK